MKRKSNQPQRSFSFLPINTRESKPRKRGLTEIRGPYYSVVGPRYLEDLFETMGGYVDSLKFAGGSFTLMPERAVREIIDLCHKHNVLVSTGGFIEHVLVQGNDSDNISANAGISGSISSKSQLGSFQFRRMIGFG
jgi:phosphosulfolactate synthase (CoM biosynthesis protein A)